MVLEDPTHQALPWQGAFTQDDVTGFRDFAHAHTLGDAEEKKEAEGIFQAIFEKSRNGISSQTECLLHRKEESRAEADGMAEKKQSYLYRK